MHVQTQSSRSWLNSNHPGIFGTTSRIWKAKGRQSAISTNSYDQMREILQAKIESENTFRPNTHRGDDRQDPHIHERLYEEGMKRITSREQTAFNSVERSQNSRPKSKKKITTVSGQSSGIKSFANGGAPSYELSAFHSSVPMSSYPSRETLIEK